MESWDTIKGEFSGSSIIVGNGLSMNLWRGFGYKDLFEVANLSQVEKELFESLGTSNFEDCLASINEALRVNEVYGIASDDLERSYTVIQEALLESVKKKHIPWSQFLVSSHEVIHRELSLYRAVYTTSYDLSIYWSIMYENPDGEPFKDLFWGTFGDVRNIFDVDDCEVRRGVPIYYLHGALHLWTDEIHEGKVLSTRRVDKSGIHSGRSMLQNCLGPRAGRRPLFVSEGRAADKRRTIAASPYLTHCKERLESDGFDKVIFGHSLSPQDNHIVKSIDMSSAEKVAVSQRRDDPNEKARIRALFPNKEVFFYDAATHPLAAATN